MSQPTIHLAVDLGATSGRVMAGIFDGASITLEEMARFPSKSIQISGSHHWDLEAIFASILDGLKAAVSRYGSSIVSVGVDTWGVDYGLVDKDGKLINLPYQYRDDRTQGAEAAIQKRVPKATIYEETGIQFLFFNTINQLFAEKRDNPQSLEKAASLLFIPDLISFWLTGQRFQERTFASTSQLFNPRTGAWSDTLIDALGLPRRLFTPVLEPGAPLGPLLPEIAETIGSDKIEAFVVGGHDTASAVAGTPFTSGSRAFLSSGTWSLFGFELDQPVVTPEGYAAMVSNEAGVYGTTRLLKNIAGMWLLEQCRESWSKQGVEFSHPEMVELARQARPFIAVIDPDAPQFGKPGDYPRLIQDFCEQTGQSVPQSPGEIIRVCYESLAAKYREVSDRLVSLTGQSYSTLHVVGGGCQNDLLNQFTANALGKPVEAGPAEATSLGNIALQLIGSGRIGSLDAARAIIRESYPTRVFTPTDTAAWSQHLENLRQRS